MAEEAEKTPGVIDHGQLMSLIRRALVAIDRAETTEFLSAMRELESLTWDATEFKITETAFVAVDFLPPPVDADAAAALTQRAVKRFEGSLHIVPPMMEAAIRSAAGERGAIKGVPRNWAVVHSIIAAGQIVHEGHVSVDQIMADLMDETE